jgi:hypothetical protein
MLKYIPKTNISFIPIDEYNTQCYWLVSKENTINIWNSFMEINGDVN